MKYSNDSFLLKPIKSKTKRLLPIDSRSSSVCVLYKQKITNFFEFPNENTDAVLCDEGYNSLTKSQAAAGREIRVRYYWNVFTQLIFYRYMGNCFKSGIN